MATHTTVSSFTGALAKWPAKVERGQKAAVNAGALHITTHLRATIAAASGDSVLSGVGKKGAKVGARYNVRGTTKDPDALITATGPLHLLERDTKAGYRQWKTRRSRRLSGGLAGPRMAMGHPGTQGKAPFAKGVAAAQPTIGRVMHKAFTAGWGF